jgi:nicotinamidase/pyrazinamidase
MSTTRYAVLAVDPQNDFCPGGALAVEGGDKIMFVLNGIFRRAAWQGAPVLISRDWHEPETRHFDHWPVHCVRDTDGAAFHTYLEIPATAYVVTKGTNPEDDGGYSAFDGLLDDGQTVMAYLARAGVDTLVVGGLATDYCVRASVLDALKGGLAVVVVEDAIRGVDLKPGDSQLAIEEMRAAGAVFMPSGDVVDRLDAGDPLIGAAA